MLSSSLFFILFLETRVLLLLDHVEKGGSLKMPEQKDRRSLGSRMTFVEQNNHVALNYLYLYYYMSRNKLLSSLTSCYFGYPV